MFTLSDEKDKSKILLLIISDIIKYYCTEQYRKISYRTSSLSRNMYITKLLTHNHPRQVQEVMQISLFTLHQFKSFCISFTKLWSLQKIRLLKKIVIFIDILRHGISNWEVQKHFQYSRSTISLCF